MGFSFRSLLDPTGAFGGGQAEEAGREAADVQARYQTEALDYLKELDALPREYREAALEQLAGISGIGGDPNAQQAMIERAQQSPLFAAMMGGLEAGEESILRHAGATGGLRSGTTQEALGKFGTQLQNQALLTSYGEQMQGLQGLAGQPSLGLPIAQEMVGIGTTKAQGITGPAQAQQAGLGMGLQTGLGIAGLFI